jgi:Ribonuclease HI
VGTLHILSNSQATIKALDSFQINSKLIWHCHQSLVKLAEHNRIQLVWVPGHMGIDGNETTDKSARQGSSHPLAGPKPAFSTYEVAKEVTKGWTSR